ncbi:MAG: glycosyltransferase family 2 protein [Gemmatimonadales bacterium]
MTSTGSVPISIVVPVRDEAERLATFLAAHSWAAERIVVDNGSRDDSADVAASSGARVVASPDTTIGRARNAGADAAKSGWVLALDIDEIAEDELVDEIRNVLADPKYSAYRIRRRNFVGGREQRRGHMARDFVTRLYRRQLRFTSARVHEKLLVDTEVGTIRGSLRHEPYRDRAHHLEKIDRYARWGAEELFAQGRRAGTAALLFRPAWKFFKAYVLDGHCLDGREGLEASLIGSRGVFRKYAYLRALGKQRNADAAPP